MWYINTAALEAHGAAAREGVLNRVRALEEHVKVSCLLVEEGHKGLGC